MSDDVKDFRWWPRTREKQFGTCFFLALFFAFISGLLFSTDLRNYWLSHYRTFGEFSFVLPGRLMSMDVNFDRLTSIGGMDVEDFTVMTPVYVFDELWHETNDSKPDKLYYSGDLPNEHVSRAEVRFKMPSDATLYGKTIPIHITARFRREILAGGDLKHFAYITSSVDRTITVRIVTKQEAHRAAIFPYIIFGIAGVLTIGVYFLGRALVKRLPG